jgi:hypothetical protein
LAVLLVETAGRGDFVANVGELFLAAVYRGRHGPADLEIPAFWTAAAPPDPRGLLARGRQLLETIASDLWIARQRSV